MKPTHSQFAFFLILASVFILFLVSIKAQESAWKPIQGGKSYETASPIQLNQNYKLSHDLQKGEFDYYSIKLEPHATVILQAESFEKGIVKKQEAPVVVPEMFGGVELQDDDGKVLQTVKISGDPGTAKKALWRNKSDTPEQCYLLVGSAEGPVYREQIGFSLKSK